MTTRTKTQSSSGSPQAALIGRAEECARLDQLLRDAHTSQSGVLVLHGERGIGKTALLDYAIRQATGFRIIHVRGAPAEAELPYAGLQLLCSSLRDVITRVPSPHRSALESAVTLPTDTGLDRSLVGLGTMTLLSHAAKPQPVLCVIDEAQWLDDQSAQVLAFVARRLTAEPIVLLLAGSDSPHNINFGDLPDLPVSRLGGPGARRLFDALIPARIDDAAAHRIVAEAHGNPRALCEAVSAVTSAEFAGGFGVAAINEPASDRRSDCLDQVARLGPESRLLLLLAAAEPTGDPALLWRSAAALGLPTDSAETLQSAGLLNLGPLVTFSSPAARSAVYGLASAEELRRVHHALAMATAAESDPDRRAWHLAQATEGPDDALADEVERCATSAQDRGGLAAFAAFLAQATLLTLDPARRVERALTAASARHLAGLPDDAARMLVTAEFGPLDDSGRGRHDRQCAQIAFAARRGDAVEKLVKAGRRLTPGEPELARRTHLEALAAAVFAGRLNGGHSMAELARAASVAVPARRPEQAVDLLLAGLAARFTDGHPTATAPMRRALEAFRSETSGVDAAGSMWLACLTAADLWDDDAWRALAATDISDAREAGALVTMPHALAYRAIVDILCGNLVDAASRIDDADSIAAAMGVPPLKHASLVLAGWRGNEARALDLVSQASGDAHDHGDGFAITLAHLSTAILHNGLGHYRQALVAAQEAAQFDELGVGGWSLVELIEAAVRAGETDVAAAALRRLSERTRHHGTNWAMGMERRSQALLSEDGVAEGFYLEAIECLRRSGIAAHLARTRLVYGEWLRRQGRRVDARTQLRAAREAFMSMGAEAFAERARHEIAATGETTRQRSLDARAELTPQETRVARLASSGLSNPQIGARLFVSPRTVEYHLTNVFAKLGVKSRTELHLVLPEPHRDVPGGED